MKMHRKLLVALILLGSAFIPVANSSAQRITVAIGDRPYYRHGPYYWHNDVRYVWVPGHYASSGRWIRGRYVARERRGPLERRTPLERVKRRHRMHRNVILGR